MTTLGGISNILPFVSLSISHHHHQYHNQRHQQHLPLPPQLFISLVFLLIDALKFCFEGENRCSLAFTKKNKNVKQHDGRTRRCQKKRGTEEKRKELLIKRTPMIRTLMSAGHYLSWLKLLISLVFIKVFFGVPLFEVPRAIVWPLGRFLAFPHGNTFEFGQIAVIPWVCLSSVCSVQLTNVLVGPLIITSSLVSFGQKKED